MVSKIATNEIVEEAVADTANEAVFFNGDRVAVFGEYQDSERSADQEDFLAALDLIEDGEFKSVTSGGLTIEDSDRHDDEVFVKYCGGDRRRVTTHGELSVAAALVD
jgi:hypothetical protein